MSAPPASHDWRARLKAPITLLVVGFALAVWAYGLWRTPYDYDEIMQIHSTWLVTTGDVPYRDFLEVHPPGFWYLLAPLLSILGHRPEVLLAIRGAAAVGHVAFIGAVLTHSQLGRPRADPLWWVVLCSVFVLSGDVRAYLAEGRMDSWGYALLLWAAYPVRTAGNRMPGRGILALSAVLSVFLVPKFSLLAGVLCGLELLSRERRSARRLAAGALAYLGGASLGFATIFAFFKAVGINERQFFEFVGLYNWRWNEWARGLMFFESLLGHSALFLLVVVGIGLRIRRRWAANESMDWYESSILLFLLAQLVFVSWPYKQYTGPWLILGLHFGSELARRAPTLRPGLNRAGVAGLAVVGLFAGATASGSLSRAHSPRQQEALARELASMVAPDGYVAAPVLAHPLFRRDTFHAWFSTSDVSGEQDLTEALLSMSPDTADQVTRQAYFRQLSERSPSLIVTWGRADLSVFLAGQATALKFYLEREWASYERRNVRGFVVYARKPAQ